MHPIAVFVASACLLGLHAVYARPTIYMVNENDKLEPALVPVSSTVIPLPVYKVSTSLGFAEKKGVKTSEPGKLITGGKKNCIKMITLLLILSKFQKKNMSYSHEQLYEFKQIIQRMKTQITMKRTNVATEWN